MKSTLPPCTKSLIFPLYRSDLQINVFTALGTLPVVKSVVNTIGLELGKDHSREGRLPLYLTSAVARGWLMGIN